MSEPRCIARGAPGGATKGPLVPLRHLRDALGLGLDVLRDRVVNAGGEVSVDHIGKIERGLKTPSPGLLGRLTVAYDLQPGEIVVANPDPESGVARPLVPIRVVREGHGLELEELADRIQEAAVVVVRAEESAGRIPDRKLVRLAGRPPHPEGLRHAENGTRAASAQLQICWYRALRIPRLDVVFPPREQGQEAA